MNSMLGALVGDAAGATLEFIGRPITEEMALNAMKMPGGGQIRVGPGQITDDGELTLALWSALNSIDISKEIKRDNITHALAKAYSKWYESIPFDMGQTCSFAFESYYEYFNKTGESTPLSLSIETVKSLNLRSEANGALMRATAIPAWIVSHPKLDPKIGTQIAVIDAFMSHPNIICQLCNALYVYAIIHLLQGESPQETLKFVDEFVNKHVTDDKIKKWYFEESLDISTLDCTKMIGHVRYGFVLAFYFLRNPHITFEEAIKITLMKGGDTDTNAAIVGGLVGAYQPIPEYMLNPVMQFDCTKQGHIRPLEYSVKHILGASL